MASESEKLNERLHFETDDAILRQKKKKAKRKKWIIIGIVTLVVVAVTAGLIGYFVTQESDNSSNPPPGSETTTTLAPIPDVELIKLDCYPEANSPQEVLTEEKCVARGCIYSPSNYEGVPDCYVDVESTGFELVSGPVALAANTMEYILKPKVSTGMFGDQFENVSFKVESISDSILHFSVSTVVA